MDIYDALLKFKSAMNMRINEKQLEGWTGWDHLDACPDENLITRLHDNANRGDFVDAANLAMMLWYRQQCGGKG